MRFAALLALLASGCTSLFAASAGPLVQREQPILVPAPTEDRCALVKEKTLKEKCADFKLKAAEYIKNLAPTDEVCLEHGFGQVAGAACRARGKVMDVKPDFVDIRVEEARADSKHRDVEGKTFRYPESALVDMWLETKGL